MEFETRPALKKTSRTPNESSMDYSPASGPLDEPIEAGLDPKDFPGREEYARHQEPRNLQLGWPQKTFCMSKRELNEPFSGSRFV